MDVVHPCPNCRAAVEHTAVRGERVQCPECGAPLRFVAMFGDGNLILADAAPEPEGA